MIFKDYLKSAGVEENLQSVLLDVVSLFPVIAKSLKGQFEGYAGGENAYGEKQLKLDVYSNELFVKKLQQNKHVAVIGSEELEKALKGQGNEYSLAFDPLDGSSLVDVNLSVGSIVGIYKGVGLIGRTGREQVAAIIAVYGPRLSFVVSLGKGTVGFYFDENKKDFLFDGELKLAAEKKMFAPGNLRASISEDWYVELMKYWVKNQYTLRYSGGMVPDLYQILKKGGGVFTYPGYSEKPMGKLRVLYECAPMAFLIENAGGKATNGKMPVLDIKVEKLDQTTPIYIGSSREVEIAESYIK